MVCKSNASGGTSPGVLLIPVALTIPAVTAYYSEKTYNSDSDHLIFDTSRNYLTSAFVGLIAYKYTQGSPSSGIVGLSSWLLSTWLRNCQILCMRDIS